MGTMAGTRVLCKQYLLRVAIVPEVCEPCVDVAIGDDEGRLSAVRK
jgi:hypothetical protein